MLTRIEIDGFKSFQNLTVDLQPFTVVAGPNASGKSNFFDALRFLSRIAVHDLAEAVQDLRGDPSELFTVVTKNGEAPPIRFAVETLLDRNIRDAFSEEGCLKYTRLRYEIEIERRTEKTSSIDRLFVTREDARLITRKEDRWLAAPPNPSKHFVRRYAFYPNGPRRSAFLETKDGRFFVNQDGKQGLPRQFPGDRATASVLSRINTVREFPHLFALREELAGIMFLQLEAAAERKPSDALASEEMLPDGSNLAKVLARIQAETRSDDRPSGDLSLIRNRLNHLIGGVDELRVEHDVSSRTFRLFLRMRDEGEFSSSVLSDGTLRLLALSTYLQDPHRAGVLLFEEPENGVHEKRLRNLVEMLRLACTSIEEDRDGMRLHQIVINTHSPVVLNCLNNHEVVAADMVREIDANGRAGPRRTRMRAGVVEELDLDNSEHRERRLSRKEADRLLKQGHAEAAE